MNKKALEAKYKSDHNEKESKDKRTSQKEGLRLSFGEAN